MIVDSSALLAVYFKESDAHVFGLALASADDPCMAAPTYLETCIAATSRKGDLAAEHIADQLTALRVRIVPFDERMAKVAVKAFLRYGKGQGHPAKLNFGDCISYALSKCEVMPLLYKGKDFSETDVESVL